MLSLSLICVSHLARNPGGAQCGLQPLTQHRRPRFVEPGGSGVNGREGGTQSQHQHLDQFSRPTKGDDRSVPVVVARSDGGAHDAHHELAVAVLVAHHLERKLIHQRLRFWGCLTGVPK